MQHENIEITPQELKSLGITEQEIADAGGIEALQHIVWFLQNTENYTDEDVEQAINSAAEKKTQEAMLKKAFEDFDSNDAPQKTPTKKAISTNAPINSNRLALSLDHNPQKTLIIEDQNQTIQEIYMQACAKNKHPALKIMLEAYFIMHKDIVPTDQDRKEILKTIALLRAFIAGSPLPFDAAPEKLIVQARMMYKEFLEDKAEYNHCPIVFLLDEFSDEVPEKHRKIAQALPISAILKIFSEYCFYDPDSGMVDEPLPEEIEIKNLCEMIETLATICKIWQ